MTPTLPRFAAVAVLATTLSACSSTPEVAPYEPPMAYAKPIKMLEQVEQVQLKPSRRGPVLTLDDVLFDFEEATLGANAGDAIRQSAKYLKNNPDRRATIEGHTDHIGDADYNVWLSNLRAESVRDALIAAGVDPARIDTGGYGEAKPVANNDTPDGRQENRRVEIVFTEAGSRT